MPHPEPVPDVVALHDFLFRLFALCMFTPECGVIARGARAGSLVFVPARLSSPVQPRRRADAAPSGGPPGSCWSCVSCPTIRTSA